VLVLHLLGLGVGLLLALLATTQEAAQDVECRLILHARKAEQVGIREGLAVEYSIHVLGSDACARVGGGGSSR
jgi:hypothetical protein